MADNKTDGNNEIKYNATEFFKKLKHLGSYFIANSDESSVSKGSADTATGSGYLSVLGKQQLAVRLNNLHELHKMAKSMGQKQLCSDIETQEVYIDKESKLLDGGYTMATDYYKINDLLPHLDDEHVHAFDIADWTGVIPEEAAKEITKAKELEVFDTIIIIGTDYRGEDTARVKREKDPVAFGMINNRTKEMPMSNKKCSWSRDMFYITDWIDEYCDLTLEVLMDKYSDLTGEDLMLSADKLIATDDSASLGDQSVTDEDKEALLKKRTK